MFGIIKNFLKTLPKLIQTNGWCVRLWIERSGYEFWVRYLSLTPTRTVKWYRCFVAATWQFAREGLGNLWLINILSRRSNNDPTYFTPEKPEPFNAPVLILRIGSYLTILTHSEKGDISLSDIFFIGSVWTDCRYLQTSHVTATNDEV